MDQPTPAPKYVYVPSLYWGIHFDIDLFETVKKVATATKKYVDLGNDRREIDDKKNIYIRSTNSDKDGAATRGFIFVDEMTQEGEEFDFPEDAFIPFEAANLLKSEKQNPAAMEFITNLYNLIITQLKKDGVDYTDKIFLGWCSVVCTWDNSTPESDEDDDSPPPQKASAVEKKSSKKSAPAGKKKAAK